MKSTRYLVYGAILSGTSKPSKATKFLAKNIYFQKLSECYVYVLLYVVCPICNSVMSYRILEILLANHLEAKMAWKYLIK